MPISSAMAASWSRTAAPPVRRISARKPRSGTSRSASASSLIPRPSSLRSASKPPEVNASDTIGRAMHADIGAFVPGPRAGLRPTGAGQLDDLAFAVKDLIDVAGHITGGGNPDWLKTHAPADRSAPAVTRLLAAGATLTGKTITDELAFSLEGVN